MPPRPLAELLAEQGAMHLVLGILANKDADAIVGRACAARAVAHLRAGRRTTSITTRPRLAERFGGRAAASLAKPRLATCPRRA